MEGPHMGDTGVRINDIYDFHACARSSKTKLVGRANGLRQQTDAAGDGAREF
jgi:hypothetical protein